MSEKLVFPEDFLWGSAQSAYQVEGNNLIMTGMNLSKW
ncbi:MAG: glycosyl hydrolase family protein [Candidatus Heimdallarchaeota archaeon]|nr:MAG: glycosyl hydrolase family protein [Candidatus Heimdallarchaeota archaeon]